MGSALDAKQCPWCGRWALKDNACNYIFACGLVGSSQPSTPVLRTVGLATKGKFVIGAGCGRPWCFQCGKKFCGQYIDPTTGEKAGGPDSHDAECCRKEAGFKQEDYCPGDHNSHCSKRW
jgi:hypothetical protein